MITNAKRNKLVSVGTFLIAHASQIDYSETRPMKIGPYTMKEITLPLLEAWFAKGGKITMDCSTAVTLIFKLAGLKDPNGKKYDYNGYGYTGTEMTNLKQYKGPLKRAHAGALLIYGVYPGTHVAMVMHNDPTDPFLFSHGSEIGPLYLRKSAEDTSHRGEAQTFLQITGLG